MPTDPAPRPSSPSSPWTPGFQEILRFCSDLTPPFSRHDIQALIALSRCIRSSLTVEERRHVAHLIELFRLTKAPAGLLDLPSDWTPQAPTVFPVPISRSEPALSERV